MSVFHSLQKLPPDVKDLVKQCPETGGGVHPFLFHLAHRANPYLSARELEEILRFSCQDCGREVPAREIVETVKNVRRSPYHSLIEHRGAVSPKKKVPDYSEAAVKDALCENYRPPAPPKNVPDTASEACQLLYSSDSLICVGPSLYQMTTSTLKTALPWIDGMQFIVPSPMSKLMGLNKQGELSQRCLDNTGPRQHLVIEFDRHDLEVQQKLLHYLSRELPLRLICHSGNRSLHGWFHCSDRDERELRTFMDRAIQLGADPMTWPRCHAVRLPSGIRNDKKIKNTKQQILEFYS